MFKGLYDEKRAAQTVAYLLHRAGGSLELLKLTKLMYLAEKASYDRYGEPLTGDSPFSMRHGPVLTHTYDRTKSRLQPEGEWSEWIRARQENLVQSARLIESPEEELLALSRADLRLLDETWGEFGGMTSGQLVDWTHRNCPEWTDPKGSSARIDADTFFRNLGMDEAEIEQRKTFLQQTGKLSFHLAVK